jgi:hypothetical protein
VYVFAQTAGLQRAWSPPHQQWCVCVSGCVYVCVYVFVFAYTAGLQRAWSPPHQQWCVCVRLLCLRVCVNV